MPKYLPDNVISKLKVKAAIAAPPKLSVTSKPDVTANTNVVPTITKDQSNVNELETQQIEHAASALSLYDKQQLAELDALYSDLPLSRLQRIVLNNWCSGRGIKSIAELSGVTPQIILLWIREKPAFNTGIKYREQEAALSARMILQNHLETAALALCKRSEEGSLKAALIILENAGVIKPQVDENAKSNETNQTAQVVNLTVNLSSHTESVIEPDDIIDIPFEESQ